MRIVSPLASVEAARTNMSRTRISKWPRESLVTSMGWRPSGSTKLRPGAAIGWPTPTASSASKDRSTGDGHVGRPISARGLSNKDDRSSLETCRLDCGLEPPGPAVQQPAYVQTRAKTAGSIVAIMVSAELVDLLVLEWFAYQFLWMAVSVSESQAHRRRVLREINIADVCPAIDHDLVRRRQACTQNRGLWRQLFARKQEVRRRDARTVVYRQRTCNA